MSYLTGLQCSMCRAPFPAEALYVCDQCLGPLEATYDTDAIQRAVSRELIESRPRACGDTASFCRSGMNRSLAFIPGTHLS